MAKVRKLKQDRSNENKGISAPTDYWRTLEQEEYLNNLIKDIPLKFIPKLPFNRIERYLEEYNNINQGTCKLTKVQQIVVKNVIHNEVRKGSITLKIIENEEEYTKPKK